MKHKNLFPKKTSLSPTVYAYELYVPEKKGQIKIGYTDRDAKTRILEQIGATRLKYKIILETDAFKNNGETFNDIDIHKVLKRKGFTNSEGEWFVCTKKDLESVILSIKEGKEFEITRNLNFQLRPEQENAINLTKKYFTKIKNEKIMKYSHFLWNAKMRFGKTFTTYKLSERMNWKKILILTFKPAVQNSWYEDLMFHVDFEDWQFISKNDKGFQDIDPSKPFVCFGSFQDYLGRNSVGGIKPKNEWVHITNWDCVVFDEYHYGAWRENAKDLFENEDLEEKKFAEGEATNYFAEENLPITTDHFLYLSGTPFRAIASGEFIEEQIFNWTYSDEQKAKIEFEGKENYYEALPRMVMMTYQLPDSIIDIAKDGEFNEFDLNTFFFAEGIEEDATFKYENEVQKWLNLIRGQYLETTVDELKLGAKKPVMPFSDFRLLNALNHTFWFLPNVASCFAMKNLLLKKFNKFYHDFEIIVAAGKKAGIGVDALPPVLKAMNDPLKSKTITLSCMKLTHGVSVKPWGGIFMLRNTSSPETYFQAAFRVQTPWTIKNRDGQNPNKEEIIKRECYIFDFAPQRALKQIADYSSRLNLNESSPEKKVAEFIKFLPVLAYDGSSMREMDAEGILDITLSGTTASLLAKRWESVLLVNVDNMTLSRLKDHPDAMKALMKIEGFRNINKDLETIINKSKNIQKMKEKANDNDLTKKEKKELTTEEKQNKSLRKQVQEKLIKFATRIPLFMYLTDFREICLEDVIRDIEPDLFKKVTGLNMKDFDLLISIGVFNRSLMNDAVYKFKRYEDASLQYAGINKHSEKEIGLWDTVISEDEYKNKIY